MESFEKFTSSEIISGKHLEGAKPVYGCLIERGSIDPLSKRMIFEIMEEGENIDYFAPPQDLIKRGINTPERYTYVISPINEKPKYSEGYKNCTGIVIVGKDKETGKDISLMTHQDPMKFLDDEWRDSFTLDLSKAIQDMRARSTQKTIDALVFGGKYRTLNDHSYKGSVQLLSNICNSQLGFEPVVITGPNLEHDETNAYLNTARRRFYLVRNKQTAGASNTSFTHSEMAKEVKKWDEVSM